MTAQSHWPHLRARLQAWTGNLMAEDSQRPALDALAELAAVHRTTVDQFLAAADASSEAPERIELIERLLIRTTWFMREPEAVSSLVQRLRADADACGHRAVSIWSVACSTGEEPYSLVMAALEAGLSPSVLATDISAGARDAAERAVYAAERLLNVPQPWRYRYFEAVGKASVRVNDAVRSRVRFLPYNLMDATATVPGWGAFHAVVCRNVLIYWSSETASEVLMRLMTACRRDGYLLLGAAEQALAHTFAEVAPDEHDGWLLRRVTPHRQGEPGQRITGPVVTVDRKPEVGIKPQFRKPAPRNAELTPPPDLLVAPPITRKPSPATPPVARTATPHPKTPHAGDLVEAARLLSRGEAERAVEFLREGARRNPTSGAHRLWLGRALKACGQLDAAIQEFRAARGLMPDDSWLAPYQLAVCLDQRGLHREALEAYRHSISVIEQGAPSGLGIADCPEEDLVRTVVTSCRQRVARLERLRS